MADIHRRVLQRRSFVKVVALHRRVPVGRHLLSAYRLHQARFNAAENVLAEVEDPRRTVINLVSRRQMVRPLLRRDAKLHRDTHCGHAVTRTILVVPTKAIDNEILVGRLFEKRFQQRLLLFVLVFFFLRFPRPILVQLKVTDAFPEVIHDGFLFSESKCFVIT